MSIYAPRLRVVSKKIHFLDCKCDCEKRRFELQRALDAVHIPGLGCESRFFNTTVDQVAVSVKYNEYRAIGHPKGIRNGEFGHVGDIFIDLTPLNHKFYAKTTIDQWDMWPGPLIQVSHSIRHPLFPRQILGCCFEGEIRTLGWHPRHSRIKDYTTPVHDVIAAYLAPRPPTGKPPRYNMKRKWVSHFDFNDGPQAKKSRSHSDAPTGSSNSTSSSNEVWRALPATVLQNLDTRRGEMTIPDAPQTSSHGDSLPVGAPASSRVSSIIMSHLNAPPAPTAQAIPPQLPPSLQDAVSAEPTEVHCQVLSEGTNVDPPVPVGLTSSNSPSMDGTDPLALNVHISPPPEVVTVTSSAPSSVTSQPIAPLGQPNTVNSDPIPGTVALAEDQPIATNPNGLNDVVLSTSVPNLNDASVTPESPEGCIGGESSVPASNFRNASPNPPTSRSQGNLESGLIPEDPTNESEASLVHDATHVHSAPAPSSGEAEASDPPNVAPIIPQNESIGSEIVPDANSREVQLDVPPNIDAVECTRTDEPMFNNSDEPINVGKLFAQILWKIASGSGSLQENNIDLNAYPNPVGQNARESEAAHSEGQSVRGSLSEIQEAPNNNSTFAPGSLTPSAIDTSAGDIGERTELHPSDPAPAIDVDAYAMASPGPEPCPPQTAVDISADDVGEREEVRRPLETSSTAMDVTTCPHREPCPLPTVTDLDRLRIEIVYARSETQTELMCRLCLGSSAEHISVLPDDTPFHILTGHCREDHAEYYGVLEELDVDQLQAILDGIVS